MRNRKSFRPLVYADWLPIFKTMSEHERSEVLLAIASFPDYEPENVALWPFFREQLEKQLDAYQEKCDRNQRIAHEREQKRTQRNERTRTCTNVDDGAQTYTQEHERTPNLLPITYNLEPKKETKKEIDKEKTRLSPSAQDASVSMPQEKKAKRTSVFKPADVPENLWCDWIALRKQKRLPLTAQALALVQSEATKAGKTLAEVLQICLQNSWAGFRANWLTDDTNPQRQPERPFYTPVHDWEEERKEHIAHAEALMRTALGGKA